MLEEFQRVSAEIKPANDNPTLAVIDARSVRGSNQPFPTLETLASFHPNLMRLDMEIVVSEHTRAGNNFFRTKFRLSVLPEESLWPLNITTPSEDNYYQKFWTIIERYESVQIETVFQYSQDISGVKPTFPYILGEESNWHSDPLPLDKWYRSRVTDEQLENGIYKWSIPLPLNGNFDTGDYQDRRYIRSAIKPDKPLTYNSDGTLNNEPEGYSDSIPDGAATIWEIRCQKDKYQNLKSEWFGPIEVLVDENLTRYSTASNPDPNTIVSTTESAVEDSAGDIALIAAGWVAVPNKTHRYRVDRTFLGGSNYSVWKRVKIAEESGEYTDRIYKRFPIGTDFDQPTWIAANRPTIDDPITGSVLPNVDWFGEPRGHTATEIEMESTAKKYIDGSLKSQWSPPIPHGGTDSFRDVIRSGGVNTFKYPDSASAAAGTNSDPETITLTFVLTKGAEEVTTGITYKWYKVYNNKTGTEPTLDGNGFPTSVSLATTKAITVLPADVTGKAVYRCYASLTLPDSTKKTFIEEIEVFDITDGKDVQSLVISAQSDRFIYDTSNTTLGPSQVVLRYFLENLVADVYWFKWNGSSWDLLEDADEGLSSEAYTILGNSLVINSIGVFAADGTAEEAIFAASTNNSNPEAGDVYDIKTLNKLASTGVGAPGEDALSLSLSNEFHFVELAQGTGSPTSGEIGETGRAFAILKLFDGVTLKTYGPGNDYTIGLVSDNEDIVFDKVAEGATDVKIFVSSWLANERKANCTVTVTYGAFSISKVFGLNSSIDPEGAIIALIEIDAASVNKTKAFTPEQRNDILLKATLYKNGVAVLSSAFDSDVMWKFNGSSSLPSISDRYPAAGTKKDLIRIERSDALSNAVNISCVITYGGKTSGFSGITINDILSARSFLLYHTFLTVPSEPISIPVGPVQDAYLNFPETGSATGWYRTQQANSFFKSIGYEQSNGTVLFEGVERFRGERGDQGDAADYRITLYRYASNTLPSADATVNEMIGGNWYFLQDLVGTGILYEAVAEFEGSTLGNYNSNPDVNWVVVQKTPNPSTNGDDGNDGWTPVEAAVLRVSDGAIVRQVVDYIGGEGTKPTVSKYIGASGLVDDIEDAVNIKGNPGEDGDDAIPSVTVINFNVGNQHQYLKDLITSSYSYLGSITINQSVKKLININVTCSMQRQGEGWDPVKIQVYRKLAGAGSYILVKQGIFLATDTLSSFQMNTSEIIQGVANPSDTWEYYLRTQSDNTGFQHTLVVSANGGTIPSVIGYINAFIVQ